MNRIQVCSWDLTITKHFMGGGPESLLEKQVLNGFGYYLVHLLLKHSDATPNIHD